ncbi:MAG: hypothetical protein ACP5NB_06800 [Chloroflexia bacterium]
MKRQVTVQVPEAEMQQIAVWVMEARPAQPESRLAICPDCLEYEITIERGGERLYFWFNDLTLDQAELAPLVNTLAHLQERVLSGQMP